MSLGESVFFQLETGIYYYYTSLHRDIDFVLIETHFADISIHVGTRALAFMLREEVHYGAR